MNRVRVAQELLRLAKEVQVDRAFESLAKDILRYAPGGHDSDSVWVGSDSLRLRENYFGFWLEGSFSEEFRDQVEDWCWHAGVDFHKVKWHKPHDLAASVRELTKIARELQRGVA